MTSPATPWIVEAIRQGYATSQEDGAITLCPEYLETVGYAKEADVLTLDVNSEAEWLDGVPVFKENGNLVFDIGGNLGFFLPIGAEVLQGVNFLVISQAGIAATTPTRFQKLPSGFFPLSSAGFSTLLSAHP